MSHLLLMIALISLPVAVARRYRANGPTELHRVQVDDSDLTVLFFITAENFIFMPLGIYT